MRSLIPWQRNEEWNLVPAFQNAFDDLRQQMETLWRRTAGSGDGMAWKPTMDVVETPEGWKVKAELPGVDKKDVHVSLQENMLEITGERKEEKRKEGHHYLLTECAQGSFMRRFTLPGGVEPNKIKAAFHNGMLEVFLPKSPEAREKMKEIPLEG